MTGLLDRLKQRKVVQWALAYAAAAFALLQGADIIAQQFGWTDGVRRGITIALLIGFFVTLVLAWYHGERGAQRVSGAELLILALLLAIGGGVLWRVAQAPRADNSVAMHAPAAGATASMAPVDEKSIAVLPLANTGGDPANEYFSDGLSEELISVLAKIPDLKTIGRSSSFHYKNTSDDSRTIGERLGVVHLLEGSVRKQGDRVRVVVDLIKAADGHELWSETYERDLKDIFAIQTEIATAVVEQLKVKLLGAQPRSDAAPANVNLAAYNALLQGQYFNRRFTEADLHRSIGYFEEAIRIDPQYPLAHALLSQAERRLGAAFATSASEIDKAYAQARESAHAALKLAPDLSEAHNALGWVLVSPDLDLPGAEAEFRRAAALAPGDARPLQALGYMRASLGALGESAELDRRALAIDPFLVGAHLDIARTQMVQNQLDAAEATLHKLLELQSDTSHVYAYLTVIDLLRGDKAAALRDSALEPAGFWQAYAVALAQQGQNDRAAADAALKKFIEAYGYGGAFQVAIVYAYRKEADKVFEWLQKSYDARDSGLTQLLVTPFLIDYRSDPRFAELCRKLKIDVAALAQRR
jgi:serine/threonine-protein kinase